MSAVRWIKVVTDLFDDEKIRLIEAMPEADAILVLWMKLLCLAGKQNNGGVFLLSGHIPWSDEMFAVLFRRDVAIVRLALETFRRYGMIEVIDGVVTLPNWEKHQSLDAYEKRKAYDRKYSADRRARQKQVLSRQTSSDPSVDASVGGASDPSADVGPLEEDKNKNKSKNKNRDKNIRNPSDSCTEPVENGSAPTANASPVIELIANDGTL